MKTVRNYMSEDVATIDEDASFLDAIALMRTRKISSLLITRQNEPVGIFTERDLLNKVDFVDSARLATIKIKEAMSGNLKSVPHDASYVDVIDLMQKHGIRHAPVTDAGKIIGIVSLRDLLNHYHENLEILLEETVTALSLAVEKRDPYTAGHQERVTQLAVAIARELELAPKIISGVNMAAIIHDIGKVYVPSEILNKSGRLSEPEMTLIKIHPQVGYDILKNIEFPWPIAMIVLQHHERMDGSGYPAGLKGDAILQEARIIAVADVVEAMASHRPYRPVIGIKTALNEIRLQRGTLYDPIVADVCINLFKNKGFAFK